MSNKKNCENCEFSGSGTIHLDDLARRAKHDFRDQKKIESTISMNNNLTDESKFLVSSGQNILETF